MISLWLGSDSIATFDEMRDELEKEETKGKEYIR